MLENANRLANKPDTTLTNADVERIVQRVAELLKPQSIELAEAVEMEFKAPELSEEQLAKLAEAVSQHITAHLDKSRSRKPKEEA